MTEEGRNIRQRIDEELTRPLPGQARQITARTAQDEMAEFMSATSGM